MGKVRYDTIIVGAGPAGSYLAGILTQLGFEVLVLEKKTAVGQNICCTGIIGKECIDLLAIDNIVIRQANSAKFFSPTGKIFRLWRNDEVAYIIDRPALDRMLANRAMASGAYYRLGAQVTDIEVRDDCLRLETDCHGQTELLEAKTAVIATGFGSPLPERLGLGKICDFVIGTQAEVEVNNNVDEVEVYINQYLAPGGFAWLVSTGSRRGLAGLITRQQPERHLQKFLLELKAQDKIASTEVVSGHGVIPLRPLPKTYTDRVLVIGEAAGQVKPITGGGIYYGLICASIAANSLHRAFLSGDFSERTLSLYQKRWQAKLGRELTVGYWVHQLHRKLSNQQLERLHNFVARSDIPRSITEWEDFSFDWHSKLVLNLAGTILREAIKSGLRQKTATSQR